MSYPFTALYLVPGSYVVYTRTNYVVPNMSKMDTEGFEKIYLLAGIVPSITYIIKILGRIPVLYVLGTHLCVIFFHRKNGKIEKSKKTFLHNLITSHFKSLYEIKKNTHATASHTAV